MPRTWATATLSNYLSVCDRPVKHRIRDNLIPFTALVAVLLATTDSVFSADLTGQASVIDGDTIEIHGTRIRLWGIDAPESTQLCRGDDSLQYRCGAKAANDLDGFIAHGYFAKVRELCSAHDVMLILDEIQTGLGRTGKLLAEQHDGIEADVTLLGKALSGGFYPVSAVLSNHAVLGTLKPGQHGSTFGGNPLACAVARAALRVLVEEGMIENAAVQGARFLDGLRSIRSNAIREVRGRGLMLAVELHPEAGDARRYCEALQARGILAKDTHERTIRIAPPLVITSDQVEWALEEIGATLRHDLS